MELRPHHEADLGRDAGALDQLAEAEPEFIIAASALIRDGRQLVPRRNQRPRSMPTGATSARSRVERDGQPHNRLED